MQGGYHIPAVLDVMTRQLREERPARTKVLGNKGLHKVHWGVLIARSTIAAPYSYTWEMYRSVPSPVLSEAVFPSIQFLYPQIGRVNLKP